MSNSDVEEDYLKGYGMALVTLINRINEQDIKIAHLEDTVIEMSNNIDAATFLLKTFIESSGGSTIKSDT